MTSEPAEDRRASPSESDFWALCEFVLDRLDEMGVADPATAALVAVQRAVVARMMIRQAATPAEPDALDAVVDVLKSLAQPYHDHREFRPSWRLADLPRLPRQRHTEPPPTRRASRNRGSADGECPPTRESKRQ
jgi:hypothetical protein